VVLLGSHLVIPLFRPFLARTLYERLGFLTPEWDANFISTVRLLVPVDDYFDDVWWPDQCALEQRHVSKEHADLLDISIKVQEDRVEIHLQVLEVKNVRSPYSDTGRQGPAEQVSATFRTLRTVLFGSNGKGRRDAPLKLAELSDLLDFHMRRSLMQHLGTDSKGLEAARSFRGRVHEALAAGKVNLSLGYSLQGDNDAHSVGVILHFDNSARQSDVSHFRATNPHMYMSMGDAESVRYVRLGSDDIACLLSGGEGINKEALRDVLDYRQVPPEYRDNQSILSPPDAPDGKAPDQLIANLRDSADTNGPTSSISAEPSGIGADGNSSRVEFPIVDTELGPVDLSNRFLRACRSYRIQVDECDPSRALGGPTVWRFYVRLGRGQRLEVLRNAMTDIGREMQRSGLLVTTIPNSNEVALDVPRPVRVKVPLERGLSALPTLSSQEQMLIPIGITPEGQDLVRDLAQMPHMLVGGTTGAGKTMFLYGLLVALLTSHPDPNTLRLLVSTSKPEDFVFFSGLSQLETGDVIADASFALELLQTYVPQAFEERLSLLQAARCRDVTEYNAKHTPSIPPLV